MPVRFRWLALALSALVVTASTGRAQPWPAPPPETQVVVQATRVMQELTSLRVQEIPQSLLASAEAVAIVPGMLRGAFVVGVQRGRGVLVVKDEAGHWAAPQFMTITGGSLGWQIGVQATDLVLVFSSRGSVQNLMQGKITVGVDASAAAGPVGRRASAATDLPMQAEIYSYSRSRGLFAGVALDGSSLQIDHLSTARYYATADAGGVPPSAEQLIAQLHGFAAPPAALGYPAVGPAMPQPLGDAGDAAGPELMGPGGVPAAGASYARRGLGATPVPPADAVRRQLAEAAPRLEGLLDPQWKAFLQLPPEILHRSPPPSAAEALQATRGRYDAIAADPQYAALAQRREFQVVRSLLHQLAAQPSAGGALPLPPPPTTGR